MLFAGSKVGVGFVAVLSFVFLFIWIASAVWDNSHKDKSHQKSSWEQSETTPEDQMKIILIISAILLVVIVLAALGIH